MDKKNILIIGAVIVIAAFLFLSRKNQSFDEMMNNLEGTIAGKTGKDAQDAMSAVKLNEEDNAYNVARQKFYSAAGKYPPQSWSIDQINVAIDNWTQIRSYLTKYSEYMGKMDRVSEAKSEVANCFDLATAERLAVAAQEEYTVYQRKEKVYNSIVTICYEYGISAADLGISDFKSESETALNNALTKANQLSQLWSKYDTLNTYCVSTRTSISQFIGGTKWYNVLLSTYDSAIANIKAAYLAVVKSQAEENAKALWANLNPYRYGKVGLESFRDRPYEAQNYLDPALFQSAVDFCAKSDDHLRLWKAAFQAEHQDYPVFRCQMRPHWPYFDTLAGLMVTCIEHSGGGTHLTGRDNWDEVQAIYDQKKPPLYS